MINHVVKKSVHSGNSGDFNNDAPSYLHGYMLPNDAPSYLGMLPNDAPSYLGMLPNDAPSYLGIEVEPVHIHASMLAK